MTLQLVLSITLLLIGIWHPYLVDVSPEVAAAVGAIFAILAFVVVRGDL